MCHRGFMLHKLHTDRKVLMNLVSYILCGLPGVKCIPWKCVWQQNTPPWDDKFRNSALYGAEICLICATLVTIDDTRSETRCILSWCPVICVITMMAILGIRLARAGWWGPSIIMTPLMSRTIRLSVYQLSLSLSPPWLPGQQPLWGPGLSIWNNELSPPSIPANSGWPPPITHRASLLNKIWATWNWNLFVIFRNW